MSNRKSRRTPATTTAPARKKAPQDATPRAHGPRVVRLPSAKALADAAQKAPKAAPQIPAPGPHTIAGMKDKAEPVATQTTDTPPAAAQDTTAQQLPDGQKVRVSLNRLAALLAIAPTKDARTNLNGVYLHQVGGELRLVATDGHRMLVLSQDQPEVLGWGEAGVILPTAELAHILKYTGKDCDETLTISYGAGHPHAVVNYEIATFNVRPVDGTFPPYARVFDDVGKAFAGGEVEPLQTAGLNAKYVKAAGAVSAALESESLFFFPPRDDKSATVFTFGGCSGAVLIVMPFKADRPALSGNVVRIIGDKGMASSIAALKAHATRNHKAAKEAKKAEDRERLEKIAASYEARIADIQAGLKPALPAPSQDQAAA